MNSFERTIIKKAGYDHDWEVVIEDSPDQVVLVSALHSARACIISPLPVAPRRMVNIQPRQLHRELERALPDYYLADEHLGTENEAQLGILLSHGARLARNLPDEPCRRYVKAVAEELATSSLSSATEVEPMLRQRIGQDIYRDSLMDYWEGACAVTGIAVPGLLRASHAKAWAECTTDADRLNVFNGFLLAAHLDALFDRHLMTFEENGEAVFAPVVDDALKSKLGLTGPVKLRWISPEHLPFLKWHQSAFSKSP